MSHFSFLSRDWSNCTGAWLFVSNPLSMKSQFIIDHLLFELLTLPLPNIAAQCRGSSTYLLSSQFDDFVLADGSSLSLSLELLSEIESLFTSFFGLSLILLQFDRKPVPLVR